MNINEKTYPQGNMELLTMFKNKTFDKELALRCLQMITDINQPILDWNGYSTTYLFEAESHNNVEAVRFLLENGADPNFCYQDLISDCALSDLHFLYEEMVEESTQRLKIAKLFFEFGANPDIDYDFESLYDHVFWEVFNDDTPHERDYLRKFLLLMIAYGGGKGISRYPQAKFSEPIDTTRINEYELQLHLCEDGYHLEGHVINTDGIDIGSF